MPSHDIPALVMIAREACDAAVRELSSRFGRSVESAVKPDGSLVTEADHAAERAILDVLAREDLTAGILAEESGVISEKAGAADGDDEEGGRWIVDPLDGTSRFARGHPAWGPLIARERGGRVVACALAVPGWGVSYWAGMGEGAWRGTAESPEGEKLRVSGVSEWGESVLAVGGLPRLLRTPAGPGAVELMRDCSYCSAGGDLSGAALVASGRAEAWIECGVAPWDTAPMGLLVTEAGGEATELTGHPSFGAGSALLVSNGAVHERVLRALTGDD